MRTIITILLLTVFTTIGNATVYLYVQQNGCSNQLAVYLHANSSYTSGSARIWNSSIFSIMWPQEYGNAVITNITGQNGFPYNFSSGVQTYGTTSYYQAFSFTGQSITYSLTAGQNYLVALIDLSYDAFIDFQIPAYATSGPPHCTWANPLGTQHISNYSAYLANGVNAFPGVFWDGSWCGGTGGSGAPGTGDVDKRCYVRAPGAVISANAVVKSLNINPGCDATVNSFFDVFLECVLENNGSTYGYLNINPTGSVTVEGPTTFSAAQQIKINADATNVGSFIDNGTINQTGGSAMVQTYFRNQGAVGTYYLHQAGPTVQQTPPGTGVYLNSFELLDMGTYAYFYQESDNSWLNVYDPNTVVPTTKGLILSTVDATDHNLSMTGQLMTGPVVTAALAHTGNNLDLISDPYPSAVDFDLFYNANAGIIGTTYYIWNPLNGTYAFYTTPTGGGGGITDKIMPGQGFFVTTLSSSPVTFSNNERVHATGQIVKDAVPYLLTIEAAGNTFKDYSLIHFMEGATYGYDQMLDADKWASIFPEATEISTISTDEQALCLNSNPSLGSGYVSVPMTFKCSAAGTYTLTVSGIESFDAGTEIYLEDTQTGAEWYDLVANPVYVFTATPSDNLNRYIVHFFGPTTGINDPQASLIRIYSWKQDAYIVNRGKETVKEYTVYDMMGRELHGGTLPNTTVNKVTIGDVSAYYIVKVTTKEGHVYTDKVYITK
jgi:hypothetical protein